ncbi:aldehyde dehydrogenase family protein, partial [Acinetobacter baumannii]
QKAVIDRYVVLGEATPGTTAIRCGRMPESAHLDTSLFMQPVLFTGLPADSPLVREEIFGPVAAIIPWDDYETVLAAANDSDYGLAA